MRNIILQHFDGELRPLDYQSQWNIMDYADMIDADYKLIRGKPFRQNLTNACQKVHIIHEEFDEWDNVLMLDIDMFRPRNMSVNVFLWRGALETIDFMPLSSTDPIGGTIITDWYSTANNENERCKLNIFITGKSLKTENLKVTSFCQEFKNQIWVNKDIDDENNIKIENAILNKAKKLRLQLS